MAVIEKASRADRWKMLDFGNLVFSVASAVPHDFKKLLPKMYEDDMPFEDYHYLAKEDDNIVGLTSALTFDICSGEDRLKVGYVGTVSTHPYRRGGGFMKACMKLLHEDMEARGVQLFVLGGRRQRYGYYGYSSGLPMVVHRINSVNVEKAMKDVDAEGIRFEEALETPDGAVALHESAPYYCSRDPRRYIHYMHSWQKKYYCIVREEKALGFCTQGLSDLELYDDGDLLKVVKAWISQYGDVEMSFGLQKKAWNRTLGAVAEGSAIVNSEMVRVVDWPAVTETLLRVRARDIAPLEDGEWKLGIEEIGTLKIVVKDGRPRCEMVDEPGDVTMNRLDAQSLLFSTQSFYLYENVKNWLPLPLWVPNADCY